MGCPLVLAVAWDGVDLPSEGACGSLGRVAAVPLCPSAGHASSVDAGHLAVMGGLKKAPEL